MTSSRLRFCLLIALLITSLLPHARPAQAAAHQTSVPIAAAPTAHVIAAPQIDVSARALQAATSGPALTLLQSVSQEPLLGGSIG